MWYNMSTNESIGGFELQKYISNYLRKLTHEIWTFKDNFFNKLIFIQAHKQNYPKITELLLEYKSHYEDNFYHKMPENAKEKLKKTSNI